MTFLAASEVVCPPPA